MINKRIFKFITFKYFPDWKEIWIHKTHFQHEQMYY